MFATLGENFYLENILEKNDSFEDDLRFFIASS